MRIRQADTSQDYDVLGRLSREYADSLGLDLTFQDFETELKTLPRQYGPPEGRAFLLESEDGEPVGCVAVRKFDGDICEMKRMYIRPGFRGKGTGRDLALTAIEAARDLGYKRMRLDTMAFMAEANKLYMSLGFVEIEPYRHNPLDNPKFLELVL